MKRIHIAACVEMHDVDVYSMNRSIYDPFSLFHYLLLLFSYSSPFSLPTLPDKRGVCSGLPSAGNRRTLHT